MTVLHLGSMRFKALKMLLILTHVTRFKELRLALKGLKLIEVRDPVVMLRPLPMFLSRLGWAPPDNVLSVVLLLTGRLLTARNEGDRCLRYFGCWSLLEA